MNRPLHTFAELVPGTTLGPYAAVVTAAANERYWRAAGIDHPALASGALYPPIAANLTILAFQQRCAEPVIQTRQRLVSHRVQRAGAELVVTGTVAARYEKRGRDYVDVHTTVTCDAVPLWSSEVTFTPTATLESAP